MCIQEAGDPSAPQPLVKPILKRLLFVDDEPNIRATLSVILRRYGFTVSLAGKVSEALEHIRKREFDLLLCDLNIEHEADGFEVIRAMRRANPHCVTIVLTGYPAVDSAVKGIHLGIDDYISKPASADALVAILAEKLAARQPKARILTIARDEPLLRTWALLLESRGYDVVASTSVAGMEQCKQGRFDVFLIGASVPSDEKKMMIDAFRRCCPAPVISIPSGPEDPRSDGADFHINSDPEQVLQCIAGVISRKAAAKSGDA